MDSTSFFVDLEGNFPMPVEKHKSITTGNRDEYQDYYVSSSGSRFATQGEISILMENPRMFSYLQLSPDGENILVSGTYSDRSYFNGERRYDGFFMYKYGLDGSLKWKRIVSFSDEFPGLKKAKITFGRGNIKEIHALKAWMFPSGNNHYMELHLWHELLNTIFIGKPYPVFSSKISMSNGEIEMTEEVTDIPRKMMPEIYRSYLMDEFIHPICQYIQTYREDKRKNQEFLYLLSFPEGDVLITSWLSGSYESIAYYFPHNK